MSLKKRFSIAPDLAQGLRSTIESVSTNQGQLHYDMMSLDAIEPDPLNPRRLYISREELMNGIDPLDRNYEKKLRDRTALVELSESIKKIGVKNAIEVYKDDFKYRIITGERRYWASLLAAQTTIPVRITQKPEEFKLRYTQWVENINRQDLSLRDVINNLHLIADAYNKNHHDKLNAQSIQSILGVSSTQAYRYQSLLNCDKEVLLLIDEGKIDNIKVAADLISMKDTDARNHILKEYKASEKSSISNPKISKLSKGKIDKIKKQKSVNLGQLKYNATAKYIAEALVKDSKFKKFRLQLADVDWTSNVAVSNAMHSLFNFVEKELMD